MNPLIKAVPPFLVRTFARRYVAGDSVEKALAVSRALWARGLYSTLDLLAENIDTPECAAANLHTYLQTIDEVAGNEELRESTSVSLKLSSYTTSPLDKGGNAEGCAEALSHIIQHATERKVGLSMDMESHHWTDFTLERFNEAHQHTHTPPDLGIVLQTRLHRCAADLNQLPQGCRVRLVIGIYEEPGDIALIDKAPMKERMLEYAATLLERGHYVEFASHDEDLINQFLTVVVPKSGRGKTAYEIQMLYGVPREKLQTRLVNEGILTRLYVPFATSWTMAVAYLRRRLDESPSLALMAGRNLWSFGGQ